MIEATFPAGETDTDIWLNRYSRPIRSTVFCFARTQPGAPICQADHDLVERLGNTPGVHAMLLDPARSVSGALTSLGNVFSRAKDTRPIVLAHADQCAVLLEAIRNHRQRFAGVILVDPDFTKIAKSGAPAPEAHWASGHPQQQSDFHCLILDSKAPNDRVRAFTDNWPRGKIRHVFPSVGKDGIADVLQENWLRILRDFLGENKQRNRFSEASKIVFGIGAQKAGTSWLHEYFESHPEIHTPELKEAHYFDTVFSGETRYQSDRVALLKSEISHLKLPLGIEGRRTLEKIEKRCRQLGIFSDTPRDHRRYLAYLKQGYTPGKWLCDITPSYMTLTAEDFAEMGMLGDTRFLMFLRDPVERLWSQVRMDISTRFPALAERQFQLSCERRVREIIAGSRSVPRRLDYARSLQELEWSIPADRIHYVFHQERFTQRTADDVCEFLNISRAPISDAPPKRGKPAQPSRELVREMRQYLEPQYRAITARFGRTVPISWTPPVSNSHKMMRRSSSPRGVSARKPVIFLHIPKTAGTTIISELERVCGARNRSPVRLHNQKDCVEQLPPGYDLYAGHINWTSLNKLPKDRFAFTVLRDPKERIASFYFYTLREAKKLSQSEIKTPERTNMRMIRTRETEDYFFGEDAGWQGFIRDQYDNFYCRYFANKRFRGGADLSVLTRPQLISKALSGAMEVGNLYDLDDLARLEDDLKIQCGMTIDITNRRLNAGPGGSITSRWDALVARLGSDSAIRKLERFVENDLVLMQALDLGRLASLPREEG